MVVVKKKTRTRTGRILSLSVVSCISRIVIFLLGIGMVLVMFFLGSMEPPNAQHVRSNPSITKFTLEESMQGAAVSQAADNQDHVPQTSSRHEKLLPGIKHNSNNDNLQEHLHNWVAKRPPSIQPEQPYDAVHPEEVKAEHGSDDDDDKVADVPGGGSSFEGFFGNDCEHYDHKVLRPSHGCKVNKSTYMVFCNFENLRIDVSKIISDRGGEELSTVMGRGEDKELPKYEKGAFSVITVPTFQVPNPYRKNMHYMTDVLNNLVYPTKQNKGNIDMTCTKTWQGTTMFITRYEYVNLFHTMTDWFNTFLSLPQTPGNGFRIVFLDAHAEGNLDPVWETVFSQYMYVKHLPEGGVCFEKAIFIPPGYVSPIFHTFLGSDSGLDERDDCSNHGLAMDFSSRFLQRYGLETVQPIVGKVIIIERHHYVSHPRSQTGEAPRVLNNLKELKKAIRGIRGVTSVSMVRLELLSFREQLETIRQAHIVIGNHGAGLSHVMFMDKKSKLIEFSTGAMYLFSYLSQWKGVQHYEIMNDEGSRLLPEAIEEVLQVVRTTLS